MQSWTLDALLIDRSYKSSFSVLFGFITGDSEVDCGDNKDLQVRRATFNRWPVALREPSDFPEAGFYYTGFCILFISLI